MACDGQQAIESAWEELDMLSEDIDRTTPLFSFTGYAGMTELKQVLLHLADNMIRYDGGIPIERMIIAKEFKHLDDIPTIYSHLYEVASQDMILNLLETNNTDYIATLAYKKGVTNSAKLTEEIISVLLKRYTERFALYEHTPVSKVILDKDSVLLHITLAKDDTTIPTSDVHDYEVTANHVILCTNGFEGFTIQNLHGNDIDTRFHHEVSGRVNYMVAYLDNINEDPIAISYFPKEELIASDKGTVTGEQYFYLTRRPHMHNGEEVGLISIGGPEKILQEGEPYRRNDLCDPSAQESIDVFLKNNYSKHNHNILEYDFCWHGLLGYTTSGIRLIGKEPCNERLLYNLGCNGIGIMPSIYGAKRLADMFNKVPLSKSIFDPREK
jgi:hypothetical protein